MRLKRGHRNPILGRRCKSVLAALCDGDVHKTAELAQATGLRGDEIGAVAATLIRRGLIERVKHGHYQLKAMAR